MGTGKTYSTKYLLDSNNSSGIAGQVLSTTSTGIDWVDANTLPGTGLWLANGNNIYNSNSGNVGVGTTSPGQHKLNVHMNQSYGLYGPSTGFNVTNESTSLDAGFITVSARYNNPSPPQLYYKTGGIGGGKETAAGNSQWGGYLSFWTTSDGTAGAASGMFEHMRITADGNVGINTTDPASKLDINSGISSSSVGVITVSQATNGAIKPAASLGISIGNGGEATNAADLWFTTATGGSLSERMRITSAGNVGIGVTNPGIKLQLVSADEMLSNFSSSVADQLAYSRLNANSSTTGTITAAAAFELVGQADASGHGRHAWIGAEGVVGQAFATKLKFKVRGQAASGYNWAGSSEAPTVMTLEGDGNVGIGTTSPRIKLHVNGTNASVGTIGTPKNDWYTTAYNGIQVGDGTTLWGRAGDSHFSGNYYVNTGGSGGAAQDTYINSLPANDFWLDNGSGSLKYRNAISGTAGDAITFNTRFVVLNNGNFGIGTTSPDNILDVVASDVNITPNVESSAVFRRNGNNYLTILSNASNEGGILFGNEVDDNDGAISYKHDTQSMQFSTADVERMRIISDGNVGIDAVPQTGMVTYVKQLRLGEQSALQGHQNGVGADSFTCVTTNFFFSTSGSVFINGTVAAPGFANKYQQQTGDHTFSCSTASGVAGGAITERIQMVIKQSGNVGINTTSPGEKLEVTGNFKLNGTLVQEGTGNNLTFKYRTANSSSHSGGNANCKFGRLYWTPAHWVTGAPVIKVTLQSKYYQGEQRQYIIKAGYQDTDPIINELQPSSPSQRITLLVGATTSAGYDYAGQPVYYADLQWVQSAYMWGWAQIESQVGFLTSNPTSGWGGVVLDSSITQTNNAGALQDYNSFFNGKVGIGTTSPTTRLHLSDSNAVLTIQSTQNGQNCSTWYKANGNNQWETGCNIGAGLDYQIYDRLNSASRMVVGHNGNVIIPGNVGIGVTAPPSKLTIETTAGNGTIELLAVTASTTKNKIIFSEAILGDESFFIEHDGAGGGADNLLKIHGDGSGGAARGVTIRRDGRVGIGNNSPDLLLHVGDGNASIADLQGAIIEGHSDALDLRTNEANSIKDFTPALNLFCDGVVGSSGTGSGIYFRAKTGGGGGTEYTKGRIQGAVYTSWTTNTDATRTSKLVIQTTNSGTHADRVTILGNGDFGINDTSPSNKLDVNGDIRGTQYKLRGNVTNPTSTTATIYDQATVGLTLSAHNIELRNYNGSSMVRSVFFTHNSATFTGDCTATNFILSSDKTLKENIKDINNNHIDVNWKNFELKSEPGIKRSGVIAQELEINHPEFVRTNEDGLKSVAYIDLLIAKIAELEARLEKAGI